VYYDFKKQNVESKITAMLRDLKPFSDVIKSCE